MLQIYIVPYPTQGEFGMLYDKRMPYETDIRVPLLVRGPGVPAGAVSDALVAHIEWPLPSWT